MSNESKIPSPAPRQRPTPPGQAPEMTEEEKAVKRQEIIDNAPLQTKKEAQPTEQPTEDSHDKPWRNDMNLPLEALMQIRKKTSINQPTEHELRLSYIANEKNKKRGFGPKIYVNDLINEAIEQYTKAELKKLGFDTK